MIHIVVIEDDHRERERVLTVLQRCDYHVTVALNGAVGCELVHEQMPDLVLCDVNMPVMDGYAVLEQLRSDERTAHLPFIFMTALSDRDAMRDGMTSGADDYLPKPFTNDELIKAINAQLNKRQKLTQKYEDTINLLRKNIVYALPHELRTPLAGSLGFAEVMRMDADVLDADQIRNLAERIVKHNQRLHRVLENFLVYAQIEVMATDSVQLAQVRNHITPHVGELIEAHAHDKAMAYGRIDDLRLDMTDLALRIADDDLSKIINELVDNAFKFSKPGDPVIVRSARDGDMYIVSVRDRGRGMKPEQITAVGAYMQFDRLLHEQQGLGLGLVIAKRLAELHDGRMTIHSEINEGTEVRVSFPLYS